MKYYRIISALAGTMALAWACTSPMEKLIREDVEVAKAQIGALMAASEEGDTVRIPATFKEGEIKYVPIDDWVSGFFAGELWYMYELTGDEMWADHAMKHTGNLDSLQWLTWHHDVGFMVGSSFGNGLRLKNIDGYKDVMVQTAKSLCTRFRPAAGIIQSWDVKGWQAEKGWACPVIIDNMMNLELLFNATAFSGDSTYFNIAVSHADKTIENHFREDGSSVHVVDYDPVTGEVRGRYTAQGCSDDSAWARGQSWGLYGFTMAYRCTGYERYLAQAEKIASFLLNNPNLPADLVPYWDYDAPGIPDTYRDASAGAIMASALYELYTITGKELYLQKADGMLETLSSPSFRAENGTNGGFILMHSVGSLPHGSSIDVPLNYADYYFLEALLRRRNIK